MYNMLIVPWENFVPPYLAKWESDLMGIMTMNSICPQNNQTGSWGIFILST